MDFSFNEEQRALEDTVRRFVAKDYTFEARRKIRDAAPGWSREVWQSLADIGVLAVNVPEEHGGLGYGAVETGLVMGAFGAGLLIEPYLASAVVAPALLTRLATPEQQGVLLPAIAGGESIAVLAHFENARYDAAQVKTDASRSGDGFVLNGHKAVVSHGGTADLLLVSARTAKGVTLFAVKPGTPGVSVRDYATIDGQRGAEVTLRSAYVPSTAVIGAEGEALAAIEQALDIGLAALCAEAVGVMEATVAATSEYLKTRKQFGQPIGRFQALQHRMADMLLHQEQSRSMSYLAAMRCTDTDRAARQKALSAAKVIVGQACRFIGQNAVQLHGGMGMTDELNVSHWFKRLAAIELSLGDTDSHLQRFAALSRAA